MGLFDSIKKLFSPIPKAEDKAIAVVSPKKEQERPTSRGTYFNRVIQPKFSRLSTIYLTASTQPSWDSFFTMEKENPKLIGFTKRSRKKFKHLYHNETLLVTYAAGVIEYIGKEMATEIILKETAIEKFAVQRANEQGAILSQKEKVSFLHFSTNKAFVCEFKWQPFTFAMGQDFWLVGTRETLNGPGELYCFDMAGNLKWGINFKERFDTVYGELSFMPYLLGVSTDSTDIFVGSMDRLYRLDVDGNLQARIAISELKEAELKRKQDEMRRAMSVPETSDREAAYRLAEQIASQFMSGFERMSLNSPFTGYAHDPETDMVFILEEKGRVSAWDPKGNLVWINTFKNEGRFIRWVDRTLVVSFMTGETLWMDRSGNFIYGSKFPNQAATIELIPGQEKFLVVCQDNRLYELSKVTGETITGSEGHPGMELFTLAGQHVFFDGTSNSQGYFWLAPVGHEWMHFESKSIVDVTKGKVSDSAVAPEITETKKFTKSWSVKCPDQKNWNSSRIVDFVHDRLYVVESDRIEMDYYGEIRHLTEKERERELHLKHHLVAYDFQSNILWSKTMYSSMRHLYLSPDGENLFTSVPDDVEITYLPGELVVMNKKGTILDRFKVEAHGFYMDFYTDVLASVHLRTETNTPVSQAYMKKEGGFHWYLTYDKDEEVKEIEGEFGAGLNKVSTDTYTLKRTDKKKYEVTTLGKTVELKLAAAIYEAHETLDGNLLVRIGTRSLFIYNSELETVLKLKEADNIQSVVPGKDSVMVMTKGETKGYSWAGTLLWRYSSIPKADSKGYWIPKKEVFMWVVGNNLELIVASISQKGEVLRSQSFSRREYHWDPHVSLDKGLFVIEGNQKVMAYKL
ncbi:ornithine cyclodeaminase [Peribacillus frigoritolerans]|uniref:Ornithine cyclodeaminase n=1 Tax=Peribacillus frigoritolerans TaxID=450367 RepID=A0AAJ1QI69_9BACI|nr:ornithine cyclodeaminase [Peribacillus frigoritolerans]MDM5281917.1 ornithine cyclodeaminase [Peribacillus frigoritolerans]